MRITFFCGGLEPGLDGVGDYTRRLAGELIRNGHEISIISLADRNVNNYSTELQIDEDNKVPVLRLSSLLPWKDRIAKSEKHLAEFNPDWLSLQFVIYSFHAKGLLLNLAHQLKKIFSGRKCHIMFHELWIGMEEESKIQFKIWGWLQKQLIKQVIRELKPIVIHTQSKVYQFQLNKLGFKAGILPLFSNIPKINVAGDSVNNNNEFSLVVFGSIHQGSPVDEFAKEITDFGKRNNSAINLKLIGRCGNEQYKWQKVFSTSGIKVQLLMDLPATQVSEVLHHSDLGISTTPYALSDKSGSVAAMLAHGLPVVSVGRPWTIPEMKNLAVPEGIFNYTKDNFARSYHDNILHQTIHSLSSVAKELTDSFLMN